MRRICRLRLPLLAFALCLAPASGAAADEVTCPDRVSASSFATQAELLGLAETQQAFGVRPTASRAQDDYIDWLEDEMRAIPGIGISSLPYDVDRWDSVATGLSAGGGSVPVAGPVPFAKSTGAGGVTAPLVYLPTDTDITAANAAGKIVVRDLPWVSVPNVLFYPPLLGWAVFDPGLTINLLGSETMEAPAQAHTDLVAAGEAGAAGVIMVSQLPRAQIEGMYAPYEGLPLPVPGIYVGVDEGQALKDALRAGTITSATLTVDARWTPATTRTLLATLPGGDDRKIVVESHTDGTSALWDNGPLAMIAMARYLASLPVACRPRTIQFAFTTGHLYQHLTGPDVREGGAGQLAAILDREYDEGKVAGVVAIEHIGARQYNAVARSGGQPGKQLVADSALNTLLWLPVTDSTPLRTMVTNNIEHWDVRRTAILKGLDLADLTRVPHNCSFGGEGTPYVQHLLPTVAGIAVPKTLFLARFGPESIDFALMRKAALAFTDIVLDLGGMSQADIAGDYTAFRQQRANGAKGCV
jgi:hypothetical protein